MKKYENIDERKCTIVYLCADSAADYLIVSPDGDIFLPEFDRYHRIGSIDDPQIIELINIANSNGNRFRKLVLGEEQI